MGTQAMGSQEGGGQQSQFPDLGRQGSLYGLTLNEVQDHLGEPLLSMNLDELLRNVLPAEGDQPFEVDLERTPSQFALTSGIQKQGSMTLARALSRKTVDEVWRDIQQGQTTSSDGRSSAHERHAMLGEMTLEDFLVKAGVVAEGSDKGRTEVINNVVSSGSTELVVGAPGYPQGIHWLQPYHQMPPPLQQQQQQQQGQQSTVGVYVPTHPIPQAMTLGVCNILDAGYADTQMASSSPNMGTLSDGTPGRKRTAPGEIVEKTVERRQKRMIKNRESAARSRARKQAYTNELENKVSRLEEENEKLRREKLELDKLLCSAPPPEPKFQLRRTSSAPV